MFIGGELVKRCCRDFLYNGFAGAKIGKLNKYAHVKMGMVKKVKRVKIVKGLIRL